MVSEEQLKEVEEMAGLFFSTEEVSLITGLDENLEEFKTAYKRGSLKGEAEIRKVIIQQAKDGSGPAQTTAQKLIDAQKRKEY